MDDLISRQTAIEAVRKYVLENVTMDADVLATELQFELEWCPSAEPQIVRCEDCKWLEDEHRCPDRGNIMMSGDFCSWGERRDE